MTSSRLLLGFSILFVSIVIVIAAIIFSRAFFTPKVVEISTPTETAIISGTIQYNGVRPVMGSEPGGRVVLYKRAWGDAEFTELPLDVPLAAEATWSWNGAESGRTYELQAGVEFLGREITRTNVIMVTAPASGEQLTFNVSEDQIPEDILILEKERLGEHLTDEVLPTPKLIALPNPDGTTTQTTITPVAISGRLNLSGYIPPTAQLALRASKEGIDAFQVVTTDIEVKDNAVWVWPEAQSGQRYRLILELRQGDVIVGRSPEVIVAAPATNQYLQLTSTAQPPAQPQYERAAIVGKIDLNGPVANNSTILILQRRPGDKEYQVAARIPAADGQSWSFDDATAGSEYEMTAALQVNENNTSSANAVTLTAPASNIVFRINTNISLDAPGQPSLLTCGSKKGDGKWPAEILFSHVQNANSYWLQVGTEPGKNTIYNERRSRSKSNEEKLILDFEGNKTYYVRYAQAQCTDCRSDQDYSGFSESVQMSCPN